MAASTITFGDYELIQRIGSGGMAEVWTAYRSGRTEALALKQLLPHLTDDPRLVGMFLDEARWLVRLNHPNIVRFVEFGEVNGTWFLAMEYVHGKNLRSLLGAQGLVGFPSPGLGALVIRDVCHALAYAHEMVDDSGQPLRLVHRDVSPSNVMLGFDGTIKLVDFGIAKALATTAARTRTGARKGTLSYMSPEQIDGKRVDHRSDVFSAGVVLYEALTGRRLFRGASDAETEALVSAAHVEPPSRINPALPDALDRVCLRALARDPDERFPTARSMALDLQPIVVELGFGTAELQRLLLQHFPPRPNEVPATSITVPLRPSERARWRRVAGGVGALALVGTMAMAGRALVVRRTADVSGAPAPQAPARPAQPAANEALAPLDAAAAPLREPSIAPATPTNTGGTKKPQRSKQRPAKRPSASRGSKGNGDLLPDPFETDSN